MLHRFARLLAATTETGDAATDAELLRQFTQSGNAAAFELLVRRHADTVWTPCRQLLRSEVDAEDAFQATFLIFARKASSIRGACVGGWLHRVAVRAALRLRAKTTRNPDTTAEHLSTVQTPEAPDPEIPGIVQEELARLPDRYRLPVVLCDLEGRTHVEVAAALGCPVGTVAGRLSRARTILRERLVRRGVAPVLILSISVAPAGMARAASVLATGGSAVRPIISSLTEGVLHAMSITKWKTAAGITAGLLGLVGATIAAFGSPSTPASVRPVPMPALTEAPEKDDSAPKGKTPEELVQDAKTRFDEFERLKLLITEAEIQNDRREIHVAGVPGKEDAGALAKKVVELERKIEALKIRQKYYADLFGISPPSKLPEGIKQIKEEMKKLEGPKASARLDGKKMTFPDEGVKNGIKATTALLESCHDRSDGTVADLNKARQGDHVRVVFATPVVVAVLGEKLEVSEVVLTQPLNTGVFWLSCGGKVVRCTKYEHEKEKGFVAWRNEAKVAE